MKHLSSASQQPSESAEIHVFRRKRLRLKAAVPGPGWHVRMTWGALKSASGEEGRIFEEFAGDVNAQPGLKALLERADLGSTRGCTTEPQPGPGG